MPSADFNDFSSHITVALDSFDRPSVERYCRELCQRLLTADEICPLPVAKSILGGLRRKRYFVAMQQVADALLENGQTDHLVSRQYGQALIDQGQLAMAVRYLAAVLAEIAEDGDEAVEVRGLLGRAHKQLFVVSAGTTSRSARNLAVAIGWYHDVYLEEPGNTWHGVNAVALLDRAARDEVVVEGFANPRQRAQEIATDILQQSEARWTDGVSSMWDTGTAMEACIALQDKEAAVRWMERYVREPAADAFELASTRRQLLEIWQLDSSTGFGALLLPVLDAQLLTKSGGELQFDAKSLDATSSPQTQNTLEAILGRDRYVSYKFMLRALERAKSVAQIRDASDVGVGTGFLIRGSDIHESLGSEYVLLTNNHVISDDPYTTVPPALEPDEATIVFGAEQEFQVRELLWSSPPCELDAALLHLEGDLSAYVPVPIAKRLPLCDGEQRVYVIGHPRGGPLSFSIHDNKLVDHEGPSDGRPPRDDVVRLHYRAPTEGGSSGSPVFNARWDAIGLHHAGGTTMPKLNGNAGSYAANEGLWLQSIRAAVAGWVGDSA